MITINGKMVHKDIKHLNLDYYKNHLLIEDTLLQKIDLNIQNSLIKYTKTSFIFY